MRAGGACRQKLREMQTETRGCRQKLSWIGFGEVGAPRLASEPASLQLDALQVGHCLLHRRHGRMPARGGGSHHQPHLPVCQRPQAQGYQDVAQPLLAAMLPPNAIAEAVHNLRQAGAQALRRLRCCRQRELRTQAWNAASVSGHLPSRAVQLQGGRRRAGHAEERLAATQGQCRSGAQQSPG